MTIHLGCTLPRTSCDQPGQRPGEHEPARHERRACCPYLVLLPVGFAVPLPLPDARCALTAPFHPYLRPQAGVRRFAFCGTFPGVASAGRYPAPCLRGARTFLTMPPVLKGPVTLRGHPADWCHVEDLAQTPRACTGFRYNLSELPDTALRTSEPPATHPAWQLSICPPARHKAPA